MKNRASRKAAARHRWDRLRVSFWFSSVLMALGAVLLAWVVYWLDTRIPNQALADSHFVLSGSVSDMRSALLNMAGTVLATAGVVFTLLTLPLSTVAAQYGSRLLRVFLGDRTTQFVLGMFVGTFVYCIAAALSIPPTAVEPEGPQLAATVGLYLMLATFATLVLLVQHISTMLQAPNIAASAGAELRAVVRAELSDKVTSRPNQSQASLDSSLMLAETEGYAVHVTGTGYLQYIDPESMLTLAQDKDLIIRVLHKPGHFVGPGVATALVWPASRVDELVARQIRKAFQIGNVRTPTQDVAYAVNQLVEMALRAMSPAINDPFTAMTCLDFIGEGLSLSIRQGEKGSRYYDREGRLRIILEPYMFDELLSGAFDMLRHASCDNGSVLLHMLAVIDRLAQEANSSEERQLLLSHVSLIQTESLAGNLIEQDRHIIHLTSQNLRAKLGDTS